MPWTGWTLDRLVILLVGLAYLLISLQLTMLHYRQNFRQWAMWGPVVEGPVIGLTAVVLALLDVRALVGPVTVLFWLGVLSGSIGFFYHLRGVGRRVDGYVLRNFVTGPPIILPLIFGALGAFGLFAICWR